MSSRRRPRPSRSACTPRTTCTRGRCRHARSPTTIWSPRAATRGSTLARALDADAADDSAVELAGELAVDEVAQGGQLAGTSLAPHGLDDQHVGKLGGIRIGLVTLDPPEHLAVALAVAGPRELH